MKNIKKPIIISGIPRSGTTPLGKVLSSIEGFSMIYEPFNVNQGINDIDFNYPYPGKNISVKEFQSIFNKLIHFKSSFKKGYLKHDNFTKRIIKTIVGNESSISFLKAKKSSSIKQLLIKDPFLLFSSEQLCLNHKVIICYRPLMPLAGSFKRMKWNFKEFEDLVNFFPINNMKSYRLRACDKISSYVIGAIQFHELFYYYINNIKLNENLYFFSQQKFSKDPEKEVTNLLRWLELEVSDKIISFSKSLNEGKESQIHFPLKNIQHDSNYNKKYSNDYYKSVLSKEEIELIDSFVAEERFELPTFGL